MTFDHRLILSDEDCRRMAAAIPLLEAELRRREEQANILRTRIRQLQVVLAAGTHPLVRAHAAAPLLAEKAVRSVIAPPERDDFVSVLSWVIARNTLIGRVTARTRLDALRLYRGSAGRKPLIYRQPSSLRARRVGVRRGQRHHRRTARSPGRARPADKPELPGVVA